jgi:SET domain-containing protein
MLTPPKKVVVKQSPGKGFGVFAADKIIKGELIERCYCITIGNNIPNSLENYAFSYPPGNEEHNFSVLPLGYGSVYNHSDENNAHWIKTPDVEMHFDFIALKNIEIGEEICTNYGRLFWKKQLNLKNYEK